MIYYSSDGVCFDGWVSTRRFVLILEGDIRKWCNGNSKKKKKKNHQPVFAWCKKSKHTTHWLNKYLFCFQFVTPTPALFITAMSRYVAYTVIYIKKKNLSVVFPLQPLGGNLPNSLFSFLFVNFQKIDFTFRWRPGSCLPLLHFVTRMKSNGWASWMFLTWITMKPKKWAAWPPAFSFCRIWQDFSLIPTHLFPPDWFIDFVCVCGFFFFFSLTGTPHTAWRFPCPLPWRRMTQTSATTPRWGSLRKPSWAKAKTLPARALRIISSREWSLRLCGTR